ncbi:MAG: hypothetical protein HFG64_05395 [Lachnospiraceae bacterium]|nr:hypothetical protein [Lachnospiraceae bacterium]
MLQSDWSKDPRLSGFPPEKLNFLKELARDISQKPKSQLMAAFASIQVEALKRGIQFSNEETQQIVSVLSSSMSPEEKRKMEMLKMLANKMAARKS